MSNRKRVKTSISNLHPLTRSRIIDDLSKIDRFKDIDLGTIEVFGYKKLDNSFDKTDQANICLIDYINRNGNQFLNKVSLAKALCVSRVTLDNWIKRGLIHHIIYPQTWGLLLTEYKKASINLKAKIIGSNMCELNVKANKTLPKPRIFRGDPQVKCIRYNSENNTEIIKIRISELLAIDSVEIDRKPNHKFLQDNKFNRSNFFKYVSNSGYHGCFECSFLSGIINTKIPVSEVVKCCKLLANLYYHTSGKFMRFELESLKKQLSEKN